MLIPMCLSFLQDLSDSPRCLLCTNLYGGAMAAACYGVPMTSDGVQKLLVPDPAFREQVATVILQVLQQCGRDVGSAGDDILTT